jgi:DNA-binding NarL/FixJ family response regulator
MTAKRVLLVDDHAIVRDGLRNLLTEEFSAPVIGEAGNAADAARMVTEQDWDLAVLDISLGGRGGLELIKELKEIRPRMRVLVLSMHSEEQYARRAFKAGASGYITKDRPRAELTSAIARVAAGGRYVSADLAERLVGDYARVGNFSPHEALSDREFEVMRLIASGHSIKDIAALLALSDRTVSTYRARLLEKMDLKTNAELTRYALHNNLIE